MMERINAVFGMEMSFGTLEHHCLRCVGGVMKLQVCLFDSGDLFPFENGGRKVAKRSKTNRFSHFDSKKKKLTLAQFDP